MSFSSASLVARNITKLFGPHVVLDRVSCTIGPPTPHRCRRAQRHRQEHAAQDPRRHRTPRLRARSPRRRRRPRSATCPRSRSAAPARRCAAYLARRTGVDRRRNCARATRPHALATDAPDATTRTRTRSTGTSRSAPPTSTRASARSCADLGLPTATLDLEMTALSGGQARARQPRRDPARPLRRVPARRAHERPRLRRPGPPRAVPRRRARRRRGDRLARPRVPRPHDHERARARRAHAPATEYAGGWQAYLDERATARRHAEEDYDDVPVAAQGPRRSGPAGSGSGRCRASAR